MFSLTSYSASLHAYKFIEFSTIFCSSYVHSFSRCIHRHIYTFSHCNCVYDLYAAIRSYMCNYYMCSSLSTHTNTYRNMYSIVCVLSANSSKKLEFILPLYTYVKNNFNIFANQF